MGGIVRAARAGNQSPPAYLECGGHGLYMVYAVIYVASHTSRVGRVEHLNARVEHRDHDFIPNDPGPPFPDTPEVTR